MSADACLKEDWIKPYYRHARESMAIGIDKEMSQVPFFTLQSTQ